MAHMQFKAQSLDHEHDHKDEEIPTDEVLNEDKVTTEGGTEANPPKMNRSWWKNMKRRLSLTRMRSVSESSDTSPESPGATGRKNDRRFSETSTNSQREKEKTAEIRERWARNYVVPGEVFVPPWF